MYMCNTSEIHGPLPFVGLFILFISLSCYSYLNSCNKINKINSFILKFGEIPSGKAWVCTFSMIFINVRIAY